MSTQIAGQVDIFAALAEQQLSRPAPCLYSSPARGLAARAAELDAWRAEHGNFGCIPRSHAWHEPTGPWQIGPTDRCQAATLYADTGLPDETGTPYGCKHGHDDGPRGRGLGDRGVCRNPACNWEGDARGDENAAAEDALDHAWPGWRDVPVVEHIPYDDGPAGRKRLDRWYAALLAAYPAGWLEAGGPIRTWREDRMGGRHVPARTRWHGYDVGVVREAAS